MVGNVSGGTKNLNNSSGAFVGGDMTSGFNLNGSAQIVKIGGKAKNINGSSGSAITIGGSTSGYNNANGATVLPGQTFNPRSAGRRVGQECVRTGKIRWAQEL